MRHDRSPGQYRPVAGDPESLGSAEQLLRLHLSLHHPTCHSLGHTGPFPILTAILHMSSQRQPRLPERRLRLKSTQGYLGQSASLPLN